MKTGCVISMALVPQMYLMERINRCEVVIMLSNPVIDERRPINRCSIRAASGKFMPLHIPVMLNGLTPADKCFVPGKSEWRRTLLRDLAVAYDGLPFAYDAVELMEHCIKPEPGKRHDEFLTDILMRSFLVILGRLRWDREIIRGDSLQRKRYANHGQFLLNLALEADLDQLLLGGKQIKYLDQRLFSRNNIRLEAQRWKDTDRIGQHDNFLDVVARSGVKAAKESL